MKGFVLVATVTWNNNTRISHWGRNVKSLSIGWV